MNKNKVLIVLGGGGYYGEMKKIINILDVNEFDLHYVTGEDSQSILKNYDSERCYTLPKLSHVSTRSLVKRATALLFVSVSAFKLIHKLRPDVVISIGVSLSVPIFVCCIGRKTKCIFIESLTRVDDLSLTGKIINRFRLSDRFYVQWKSLSKKYGRSVFSGKIL